MYMLSDPLHYIKLRVIHQNILFRFISSRHFEVARIPRTIPSNLAGTIVQVLGYSRHRLVQRTLNLSLIWHRNLNTPPKMPSPVKRSLQEPPSKKLRVVKLSEKARIPTQGSPHSAGYDLYSAADLIIPPMGKAIVPTDLRIAVPEGTYGRVAPRSGLAAKHHIDVGAGVVDADYRGPVGVVLFNHAQTEFQIKEGDRVAQLICEKVVYAEVEEVKDLSETDRGEGGFGSTGHN